MLNLTVQASVNQTECLQTLKKTKHGKHREDYFISTKWREYNRLKQQQYRLTKQALKLPKPISPFQKDKTQKLLKLLVNHRSFVPVPQKLKHPIIKNWNAENYWYNKKIDLNNLERGCVRIYEDNWKNCAVIWLDIDQKGWTKLAKQLRCGYINSPKKHIRIPVPVRNLAGYKTGVLYHQDQKIGDAKLSGEVMLPNQAYYNKKGQFLGHYRYKAWGTFFPFQNKIWKNAEEFFNRLAEITGIQYLTIKEHLLNLKIKQKIMTESDYNFTETVFIPVPEPPWQKTCIHQNNVSKIANY